MSVPFHARDVVAWTGGKLARSRADARFTGTSIDTRTIGSGELFVAIVGESHDAHGFLSQAAGSGASGFLIERGRPLPENLSPDLAVIEVDDTTVALGALAAGHRAGFDGALGAITGSNGKTTTKEMCAAILSVHRPCLKNAGNLNNHYGLPLTLLRRAETDHSVVVEIGMNHRGEIAQLAAIAKPTVGVVTNAGTAHIEHLGSRDAIAQEKGDLVASLEASGTAVLNADDPRVSAQAARTRARVWRFGLDPSADVRGESVREVSRRGFALDLCTPEGRAEVLVTGLGETTVINALAAAGGALAAGATLAHVVEGLAKVPPVSGRLQRVDLPGDRTVIDDTYNANPQSMAVGLRSLASLRDREGGRALAVLGSMGELGNAAIEGHREVGRQAAAVGLELLLALGPNAQDLVDSAVEAGLPADRAAVAKDHDDALARLRAFLREGDRVLVKGSRAMQMERVVRGLAEDGAR